MKSEKASVFFTRAVYALTALLFGGIILLWIFDNEEIVFFSKGNLAVLGFAALMTAAALVLMRFVREIKLGDGVLVAVIAAACFAVKLIAVLRWRVEPSADYETFFRTASDLASTGEISLHRYVALFPHIYGYSAFLSIFFRIFGATPLVAAIVNAGLSAVSAVLLYLLVRRFGCKLTALAAALLWTLCPSQTLYNIYVLSEPYYTTLLFGVFLILDILRGKLRSSRKLLREESGETILLVVCAGALLALVQVSRPIAAIPMIAFAGVIFLIDLPYDLRGARNRITMTAALLILVMLVTALMGHRLDAALGEEAASSVGYSYAVGLNEESGGKWSADVSARLFEYSGEEGATAEYAQQKMMEEVKALIASGEVDYLSLAREKISNLLLRDDSAVVSYGAEVFYRQELFSALCNGFWLACALFAAFGAVMALIRKERGVLLLVSLYAIGLTLAQMLVEVAYRYHYSIYVAMLPLAAYGLHALARLIIPEKKP